MSAAADDVRLATYRRGGGRPPADDETLEVDSTGAFSSRRTVGGPAAGSFAGRLAPAALQALTRDVAALDEADDLAIETPRDGATEVVQAAGRRAVLGANATPPAPWRALVRRLRTILHEQVPKAPVAAIELHATTREAWLAHAGSEPLEVDLGAIEIQVVRLDGQGIPLGRWFATTAAGDDVDARSPARWATATTEWREPLPFAHTLELAAGDALQVSVTLPIRQAGTRRVAKVAVYVRSGA
jgi:hypothetical protein